MENIKFIFTIILLSSFVLTFVFLFLSLIVKEDIVKGFLFIGLTVSVIIIALSLFVLFCCAVLYGLNFLKESGAIK